MSYADLAPVQPGAELPPVNLPACARAPVSALREIPRPGALAANSRIPATPAVVRVQPAGDEVDGLLARTALGDNAAFERLHAVTRSRLLGLALRVLGNRAHAEEVLQEAYLTIWQRAAQRRPAKGSGSAWMATIVRNRAIDRQRRLVRDPCIGGSDRLIDEYEALARSTDERVVAIGPNMARLSVNHRAALRAAYFHGLSHSEVANRLGVPLGTAKSWIRRGLLELRGLLEPEAG